MLFSSAQQRRRRAAPLPLPPRPRSPPPLPLLLLLGAAFLPGALSQVPCSTKACLRLCPSVADKVTRPLFPKYDWRSGGNPGGLAGDFSFIVFVTSQAYTGDELGGGSPATSAADCICFSAFLSSEPHIRVGSGSPGGPLAPWETLPVDRPYKLVTGEAVANVSSAWYTWPTNTDTFARHIDRDEHGALRVGDVWTGPANNPGDSVQTCSSWTVGSGKQGTYGHNYGPMIDALGYMQKSCDTTAHLYCLQVSVEGHWNCTGWECHNVCEANHTSEYVPLTTSDVGIAFLSTFSWAGTFIGWYGRTMHYPDCICQAEAHTYGLDGLFSAWLEVPVVTPNYMTRGSFLKVNNTPHLPPAEYRLYPGNELFIVNNWPQRLTGMGTERLTDVVEAVGLTTFSNGSISASAAPLWLALNAADLNSVSISDCCCDMWTSAAGSNGYAVLNASMNSWADYSWTVDCGWSKHFICMQVGKMAAPTAAPTAAPPFWQTWQDAPTFSNVPCSNETTYDHCQTESELGFGSTCSPSDDGDVLTVCKKDQLSPIRCTGWEYQCAGTSSCGGDTSVIEIVGELASAGLDNLFPSACESTYDLYNAATSDWDGRGEPVTPADILFEYATRQRMVHIDLHFDQLKFGMPAKSSTAPAHRSVEGFVLQAKPAYGDLFATERVGGEDTAVSLSDKLLVKDMFNASHYLFYKPDYDKDDYSVESDWDFFVFQLLPKDAEYTATGKRDTLEEDLYTPVYLNRLSRRVKSITAMEDFISGSTDGNEPEEDDMLLIVGMVVGGVIVFLLLAILCLVKRRRSDARNDKQPYKDFSKHNRRSIDLGDPKLASTTYTPLARQGSGIYDNNNTSHGSVGGSGGGSYGTGNSFFSEAPTEYHRPDGNNNKKNMSNLADEIDKRFIIDPTQLKKGKKIGQGAYGWVYKGKWRRNDVAIKEVNALEKEAARQLMDEASAMSRMRPHGNVVALYGVLLEPNLAIVTEFCDNGSLDDKLYGKQSQRYAFSDAQLYDICMGVSFGVAHLHADNIVHRDLAARNVLLDKTFCPKVADFGMIRENAEEEKGTKTTIGPIRWMAPEQLSERKYSKASDVYALGCIFWEVYAKCVPFPDLDNVAVITRKLQGEAAEPDDQRFPAIVAQIMRDTFAFTPGDRPTADEVSEALEKSRAMVLGARAPPPATQVYTYTGGGSQTGSVYDGSFLTAGGGGGGDGGGGGGGGGGTVVGHYSGPPQSDAYDAPPQLPPASASVDNVESGGAYGFVKPTAGGAPQEAGGAYVEMDQMKKRKGNKR